MFTFFLIYKNIHKFRKLKYSHNSHQKKNNHNIFKDNINFFFYKFILILKCDSFILVIYIYIYTCYIIKIINIRVF